MYPYLEGSYDRLVDVYESQREHTLDAGEIHLVVDEAWEETPRRLPGVDSLLGPGQRSGLPGRAFSN